MFTCNELIHPFQYDPGVSQQQRVMEDLLSGAPKIDGRSLADLLNYFVQLSPHINYYDEALNVSDWQPFFKKSIPFALASIIKFDRNAVTDKIDGYNKTFNRHPSKAGLQLLLHYIFQKVINRINEGHLQVKGSGLPAEFILEKLIKDKLQVSLKQFICSNNKAVKYYCIKPVDFSKIAANEVWGIDMNIENSNDACKPKSQSKRKRIIALRDQIQNLLPSFLDALRIIADTAGQSLEQSLFPLKEELQKKHTPHLALLFAFLKLFQHLQGDLNKYTKKHLDFFYKQVLKLNAREAVPDKAHIVFEIQKQLNTYLLKKGLMVKDGKDTNKAEILFALDEEIVVNKTQVADKRTLFVNNQNISEHTYIEGVYMAPNTDKADGLLKDFKDNDFKSFATAGAKVSKYTDPEKTFPQPYPNARIGFILASPVLLLNEGTRTIDITLACRLSDDYCNENQEVPTENSNNCCEERTPGTTVISKKQAKKYPDFIKSPGFYGDVVAALNETWYYISEDLVIDSVKKGISKELEKKLREFLTEFKKVCYCPVEIKKYDAVLKKAEWDAFYVTANTPEKKILDELIKPRKALKISFSGEKEWVELKININPPSQVSISPALSATAFLLKINVTLDADQPAITFYDKEKLKEDFNTTLPLVKIELDDKVKLALTNDDLDNKIITEGHTDNCLLLRDAVFCITKDFITDTVALGMSNQAKDYLLGLLTFQNNFQKTIDRFSLECLLDVKDATGNPTFNFADKNIINGLVNNPVKKYCQPTQHSVSLYHFFRNVIIIDEVNTEKTRIDVSVCGLKNFIVQNDESVQDVNGPIYPFGPTPVINSSFYIGCPEIFNKNWKNIQVNHNWKDKPSITFEEYYTAYQHMFIDPNDITNKTIEGIIKDNNYKASIAVLVDGKWFDDGVIACDETGADTNNLLFRLVSQGANICPDTTSMFDFAYKLARNDFPQLPAYEKGISCSGIKRLNADTRNCFLRITLRCQNFQHDRYAFILSRQMMAFGRLPADLIAGAYYRVNPANAIIVFNSVGALAGDLDLDITTLQSAVANTKTQTTQTITEAHGAGGTGPGSPVDIEAHQADNAAQATVGKAQDVRDSFDDLALNIPFLPFLTPSNRTKLEAVIPNEPWTPIIKNISLDYTATATATDIDLIHLYPYDGTYKSENITLGPTLFPTFCDEGTLFIGLKDLKPGSNVNMLFQLAEATADSEAGREDVTWYYLDNNQWKQLRTGFEILDDATDGLTTSGIVKFSLPENMTNDNTILPKDLHWIKASVPKNSTTVSETMGIHTQAIRVIFTNEDVNDKLRLSLPLEAGKISKLNEADANVKKLIQPYDSFDGRVPEADGSFYVRVSELLRHKGRAIQKFDYERLVLEAFPKIFKVKCVNHSFALNAHKYKNDFPIAPGYVLLAVIPDLNQLKAAKTFTPKVPVSMLDDIQDYCKKHTSPFVRFRAMNPRYEKVHFCLKIKLVSGKDENYYKEKLMQDLREYMAPWAIGEYDKLRFGQCVGRSEIIRFLESRDYVNYIIDLVMHHEEDDWPDKNNEIELAKPVCPKTPRSILIAGDIDVCIPGNDCEEWGKCTDAQGVDADCCDNKKNTHC